MLQTGSSGKIEVITQCYNVEKSSALDFREEGGVSEKSSLVSFRSVKGDYAFWTWKLLSKEKIMATYK